MIEDRQLRCDGEHCRTLFPEDVTEPLQAEVFGWSCTPDRDLCPDCQESEEDTDQM